MNDTVTSDEAEADLSDANSDEDQDAIVDVPSHRISQPFLPVNRENLDHISGASDFKYFYEDDLRSMDLIADCDEELHCSDPKIDVDKFFVKVPTKLISHLTLCYTSKPFFLTINCPFADTYTLQLTSDPFCISVPLSGFLKANIIESLSSVGDVLCYPNSNPRVLSARQIIFDSTTLQEALLASGISSVFLSSYGGKLSLEKFESYIGNYVEPWSAEYISNISSIINIPDSEARRPSQDPVILQMNNTFDIGKTYHTGKGSIIAFTALGQRKNRQWRNMYHLLGALTNNPYHPEITFGGLRFTHKQQKDSGQYTTPEDRILRRTVYLVCL